MRHFIMKIMAVALCVLIPGFALAASATPSSLFTLTNKLSKKYVQNFIYHEDNIKTNLPYIDYVAPAPGVNSKRYTFSVSDSSQGKGYIELLLSAVDSTMPTSGVNFCIVSFTIDKSHNIDYNRLALTNDQHYKCDVKNLGGSYAVNVS